MTRITLSDLISANDQPRAKKPSRGLVCFTWDDNFTDWMTEVADVAALGHQRHTFFIRTDQIDTGGHLSSAQILELFQAGHEIGSHSVSHQDMTTLTAAQRQPEWDNSKAALEAIVGSGNVTSWAYPYGTAGSTPAEALGRYERICLVANNFVVFPRATTPRRIGRLNWTDTNTGQIKEWVRYAAQHDCRVVILCHDPGAAGYPTVQDVADVLNLATSLKVPCVRLDEAFSGLDTVPNSGFERGLDGWTTTATGAGTATTVVDTPDTGLPGTHSAKLSTTNLTDTVSISTQVPIEVGAVSWAAQCRARVNITNAGSGSITMTVEERGADGSILATNTSTAITSTTWAKPSKTFTPNIGTAYGILRLKIDSMIADAWFDHCAVAPAIDVFG